MPAALFPSRHVCHTLACDLLCTALAELASAIVPPPAPVTRAPSSTPSMPRRNWPWTRDEMVGALQQFVATHARLPVLQEWERGTPHGLPGHITVNRLWGTRAAFIRAAGFTPPPRRTGNQYTTRK